MHRLSACRVLAFGPLVLTLAACGGSDEGATAEEAALAAGVDGPPTFQVDPSWPQEMPDLWILGAVTAVFVDDQDHVWVAHLPETLTPEETSAVQDPPIGTCCVPAPVVVEFDPEGRVVQGWGTPSQDVSEYPRNPHGLFVDHNSFVWVGTYRHHRVMKFTRDGQLVMTLGTYDETGGSDHASLLGGPAGIWVDPTSNEVFIADGYANRRVVVFDGETGEFLRHWGAYGEAPDDEYEAGDRSAAAPPPEQFSTVHGLVGSNDGFIYVADRRGNRIQVFQQDGTFVTETIVAPGTLASGSAFVVALSPDPAQEWLYLADGTNHKVWVMRRGDLEIVGEFGRGGRQVGQFLRPHGMSVDSRGNIYVGEASTGRRVQKFTVSPGS
jgi:DNA-binding beta-propeller fold protein YncE